MPAVSGAQARAPETVACIIYPARKLPASHWLAIFWRAYIHFSLVRVADLNSVLRAKFGAYKNQRRAAFYFSTEFLGCAKCECFAGAVSHCNFALCVATKLAWVGACIPPGIQNTSLADCVAWERGGYAETRPAANNAVSCVTTEFLCPCFSHPRPVIARLQEFPQPPPYRAQLITQPQAQLIPHPSHNHPTKHSSTQQENVRRYTSLCKA